MDAGKTAMLVANFKKRLVKFANHRRGEELTIVVPHVGAAIQKIADGLETISKFVGKAIPKLRTPQSAGVHLERIAEEA